VLVPAMRECKTRIDVPQFMAITPAAIQPGSPVRLPFAPESNSLPKQLRRAEP